ncbi:MAG: DnaD domain protein, partial [Clostridia bacterium]
MTFCQYERPQLSEGNTVVENSFITQYMPDAPTKFVEVYLLGLSLCQENSNLNNLATICNALAIPPDDVINAFMYWEELGIVRIVSPNPPQIVFLSIKSSQALLKKVKPTKYNKFCKEIQDVINGRMITTTEYNEYFIFMESKFFDPEALVCVARYCVENKGADIGYNYILTVARNLACQGYNNLTQVSEKLNSAPKYNDDLSIIFKTLKVNHKADFSDRELYEKWITDYGFTFDVINS